MRFLKAFLALFLIGVFHIGFASATYYEYEKLEKGKTTPLKWEIIHKKKHLFLTCHENIGITAFECLPDYKKILKYSFTSANKKNSYSINLHEKKLHLELDNQGKKKTADFQIATPWVQQFGFGLMPFVKSNKKSFKFCLINTDKAELINMVAEKKEKTPLKINNQEYQSQHVKVTLTGFKSMFWSAEMWFNTKDGDLLKYVADSGPGTPITTITFKSKKEASLFKF